MDSHLDEDREFFLEVIDDLAQAEEVAKSIEQATAEQKARWEHELNQLDGELRDKPVEYEEETPEQFRQQVARETAEQLLMHRRFTAKTICKCVARVGRSRTIAAAMLLKEGVGRLQILDSEIERRHLGRGSAPPDGNTPKEMTEDS
jgi:hypothetical protein